MDGRWEDAEQLLVQCAAGDLAAGGDIAPALVAFAGEHPRFLAWLRPFPAGGYRDPLIELLALAMPLDADRLMLSIAGRAWSMADPIPPVTSDADLRQRALVIHSVDGAQGRPRTGSVLHPFDVPEGGDVRWGEARRLGAAEGWIVTALELAVRQRRRLPNALEDIRAQAERVVRLGHQLYLDPAVARHLALAGCIP